MFIPLIKIHNNFGSYLQNKEPEALDQTALISIVVVISFFAIIFIGCLIYEIISRLKKNKNSE